jgi:hypothetical protein
VAVEFPRKGLASNRFYGERFTRWSSVTAPSSRSRAARSSGSLPLDRATALKVRAASTLLPTLFPSSTGSRLSPSSSHGAIHEMAQTGRSNVRYVDPQRRYTVVLGPSWNAPIGALPHDDRAGTHDSADGRCGSYASIGSGQAPTKVFRRYPQSAVCSPLEVRSTSISGIHLRTRALPGRAISGCEQSQQGSPYSITSSARASKVAGTSMPSILAVCRLTACMTGRLAGFSPLRMRPTYMPAWRSRSTRLDP